ncbi:MAG: histidine phosphatase family protein [Pseudomonadota bacterium]
MDALTLPLPQRRFVFLRHGQTEFNREGRFQGKIDVPLNDAGHAQAQTAAAALAGVEFSRVVSSPARRVLQTVEPLLRNSALEMHVEDHLMEMSVGSFEGQLIADIRREHGLQDGELWLSILPADAERWQEFEVRVCAAVTAWTEMHSDETILIASHGLVFHALAHLLTGQKMFSGNAQAHIFEPGRNSWTVSAIGAASPVPA